MRWILAAIGVSTLMGGCAAQGLWVKPDFEQGRFAQDRYACMQQGQVPVSNTALNAYGGYSQSTVAVSQDMFAACMSAKGYRWRVNKN